MLCYPALNEHRVHLEPNDLHKHYLVDLAAILVSKADYLISEPYLLLKAHNDGLSNHEWQTILHGPGEVFLELVSGLIEVVLEFVAPVLYELDTTRLAKL